MASLAEQISAVYQLWGGRPANASELGVWSNAINNGGATFDTVKYAILNDPLGRNYLPVAISAVYQQWGGRAADGGEIRVWSNAILSGGATFDTVKTAILHDPLGQNYLPGAINAVYQMWGGRVADGGEIGVWSNAILNGGASFDTIKNAILNDPLGRNYLPVAISAVYQQWGGRGAGADEIAVWTKAIANGATLDTIKGAILHDPLGQNYLPGAISAVYRTWGGRAANDDEVRVWSDAVVNGSASFDTIKNAILSDPLGRNYLPGAISAVYQQWGGRSASGDEVGVWSNAIVNGGASFDTIKIAILNDPLGHGVIDGIFHELGGRQATPAEISSWIAQLSTGGANLQTVRDAVFAAADLGQTYLPAQVAQAMAAHGGRAPNSAELAQWMSWLHDGGSVAGLPQAVVSDLAKPYWNDQLSSYLTSRGLGTSTEADTAQLLQLLRQGSTLSAAESAVSVNHTNPALIAAIAEAYSSYLGRVPSTAEMASWSSSLGTSTTAAATLRASLLGSSEGAAHTSATITAFYQQFAGRAPSSAELTSDTALVVAQGMSFDAVKVDAVFRALGGRAATTDELSTWTTGLAQGATVQALKNAVIDASTLGQAYLPAQITAAMAAYGGRAPTSGETAQWIGWLRDTGTVAGLHDALVTDLGKAYWASQLIGYFADRSFGSPSTSEIDSLLAQLRQGSSLGQAEITVATGHSNPVLIASISDAYIAYLGRAPSDTEVASWSSSLATSNSAAAALRANLLGTAEGIAHTDATVTEIYHQVAGRSPSLAETASDTALVVTQGFSFAGVTVDAVFRAFGGRAATDSELSTWTAQLADGSATLLSLKHSVVDAAGLGQAYLPGEITAAMAAYGGRAPTTAETSQWVAWLRENGSVAGLHDALVTDLGKAYWAPQLTGYFAEHGFGSPSASEVDSLLGMLHGGQLLADAELAIGTGHLGTSPFDGAIYDAYESFAGRAPTTSEYLSWRGSLTSTDTAAAALKASVVGSPAGQAYLAAEITDIFQQAGGRAPTSSELATWQAAIANDGATYESLRMSVLGTAADQAHVTAAVTMLYEDYLGRTPTTTERDSAMDTVSSTHDFTAVVRTVFTSAEGIVNLFDVLHEVYPRLMGRAYNQAEQNFWFDAIYNQVVSLGDIEASLMLDPGSAAARYAGTPALETIGVQGTPTDVVITQFDPVNDTIRLDASLAGTNLLDAAHARELSVDGVTPDVLIRLSDHQNLLLHGVHLSQLSSADFVFA